MFYQFGLTIPANTLKASPAVLEVAVSPGNLVSVSIQFPRGCVGLVHTVATRAGHQLWPTNSDGDLSGEDAIIPWQEDLVLEDDPYVFQLRGWSDDDSFPHTLTWRFNVLSIAAVIAARASQALVDQLRAEALAPSAPA